MRLNALVLLAGIMLVYSVSHLLEPLPGHSVPSLLTVISRELAGETPAEDLGRRNTISQG